MHVDPVGIAIALMAAVTYLTRIGGVWIVAAIGMSEALERFLKHLSGSIIAALLVPVLLDGSPSLLLGVAAAVLAMMLCGRALPAMAIGCALAASWRAVA